MKVKTKLSADSTEVTITIEGHFDFNMLAEFNDVYTYQENNPIRYLVDLTKARYMDSSALGMLLLLYDHAVKTHSKVAIRGPSEEIRRTLEIAHFDDLFTIEPAA